MCFFLTGYLKSDSDVKAVRKIAIDHNLAWTPIKNDSIMEQLESGATQYLTNKEICGCYLSPTGHWWVTNTKDSDLEKKVKKLRKKGWSESKINKWVEEKEKDISRKFDSLVTSGLDGKNWLSFLSEVFESGSASSVGVLFHFYGDLEKETIDLISETSHSIGEIDEWFLQNLKMDHFYWFTR